MHEKAKKCHCQTNAEQNLSDEKTIETNVYEFVFTLMFQFNDKNARNYLDKGTFENYYVKFL